MREIDESDALLLALVTNRGSGQTVASLVSEVLTDGVNEVWRERFPTDLLGSAHDDLLERASDEVRDWRGKGYRFTSILRADYPRRLRSVHDAPPFLFYRGELGVVQSGGISVVGSRDASPEGTQRAADVARHLVERQIPVISGLARGIDFAAHTAALEAGGVALGVIASGIAGTYTPASSRDLHSAVAARGALVSQFWPSAHALRHTFLQRNATMSGLGFATFVIEAGETSGARAQARLAMQHGRPVILTDRVVECTQWGRALADGQRANVHVVTSRADMHDAVSLVTRTTSLSTLDDMLVASL